MKFRRRRSFSSRVCEHCPVSGNSDGMWCPYLEAEWPISIEAREALVESGRGLADAVHLESVEAPRVAEKVRKINAANGFVSLFMQVLGVS